MKTVFTGLESSGKSLLLSREAEKTFRRNVHWFKITGVPRTMAFNMPMSETFIQRIKDAGLIYLQWEQFFEVEKLTKRSRLASMIF